MKLISLMHKIIVAYSLLLISGLLQAEIADSDIPEHVAIFKLPNNETVNWKSGARTVTPDEGIVEYIPLDQTIDDWNNLITIQYFRISGIPENRVISKLLPLLEQTAQETKRGQVITFNVINKEKTSALCESSCTDPKKECPSEYEVVRLIYFDHYLYRIAYSQKHIPISSQDRSKWIQLLSNEVKIISKNDFQLVEDLSLMVRSIDHIELPVELKDWPVTANHYVQNYHRVVRASPRKDLSYIDECFEVRYFPGAKKRAIDEVLEVETQSRGKKDSNLKVEVLSKSDHELLCVFVYTQDKSLLTEIVRTWQSDQGEYFSLVYKKLQPEPLTKEQTQAWTRRLEAISLKQDQYGLYRKYNQKKL